VEKKEILRDHGSSLERVRPRANDSAHCFPCASGLLIASRWIADGTVAAYAWPSGFATCQAQRHARQNPQPPLLRAGSVSWPEHSAHAQRPESDSPDRLFSIEHGSLPTLGGRDPLAFILSANVRRPASEQRPGGNGRGEGAITK
jgi:hypothetical protein